MSATGGTERERADHMADSQAAGDIPADTFAARLVLSRHHAGRLSQREAAERCGLNYASWSNWEDGMKPRDKVEVAQAIADGLGMNFDWLLFGGDLLPARGRPVKRTSGPTHRYNRVAVRATQTGTNGLIRIGDTPRAVRASNVIVRSHPAAA